MTSRIFTFGCGQKYNGFYTRIYGKDRMACREEMFRIFGSAWCSDYTNELEAGVYKYQVRFLPIGVYGVKVDDEETMLGYAVLPVGQESYEYLQEIYGEGNVIFVGYIVAENAYEEGSYLSKLNRIYFFNKNNMSSNLPKLVTEALKVHKVIQDIKKTHLSKFEDLLESLEARIQIEMQKEGTKSVVIDNTGSISLVERKGSKKVDVDALVQAYNIPPSEVEKVTTIGKGSTYLKINLVKQDADVAGSAPQVM
jgi:hypothetical protein